MNTTKYRVHQQRSSMNPNYAIVRIPDTANVLEFYQLLVSRHFLYFNKIICKKFG